jgi:hypothetical protein
MPRVTIISHTPDGDDAVTLAAASIPGSVRADTRRGTSSKMLVSRTT